MATMSFLGNATKVVQTPFSFRSSKAATDSPAIFSNRLAEEAVLFMNASASISVPLSITTMAQPSYRIAPPSGGGRKWRDPSIARATLLSFKDSLRPPLFNWNRDRGRLNCARSANSAGDSSPLDGAGMAARLGNGDGPLAPITPSVSAGSHDKTRPKVTWRGTG